MSDKVGIISLGFSCQVAEQLNRNVERLSASLDTPLGKYSSYFDFIITPSQSLSRLLKDFEGVPQDGEIVVNAESPYWAAENIWFEHNFRRGGSLGPVDLPAEYAKGVRKITHLHNKFNDLAAQSERFIFVLSNAQAMDKYILGGDAEESWFRIDRETVSKLKDLLLERFGDKFSALLVVEGDFYPAEPWEIEGVHRAHVKSIPAWWGDDPSWVKVFETPLFQQ